MYIYIYIYRRRPLPKPPRPLFSPRADASFETPNTYDSELHYYVLSQTPNTTHESIFNSKYKASILIPKCITYGVSDAKTNDTHPSLSLESMQAAMEGSTVVPRI